eukprot:CAMPEP_0196999712 /NCGR_PEP_ID=MMETSP1380-20130617/4829_1 /TAXON_ID=5936 /ORGANISM="Euplotes crassus, Strain CT5" /LENGTH=166 /DNA_ID=CAMNT_0042416725 /DNA_START=143 /DNA_END=640 /DNA_ORIENTATION=+
MGIDFKTKYMTVKDKIGKDTMVRLTTWDTAGQERFRTITQSFYNKAEAILLVYDCTERSTFETIENWLKSIEVHAPKESFVILVANKIDSDKREVTSEEGEEFARENGLPYFETSAKTGEQIDELFEFCTKQILWNKSEQGPVPPRPITITSDSEFQHPSRSSCFV